MALGFRKIMIEIQGQIFDLWHLSSAEKEEEWNDKKLAMEYYIMVNKTTVSGNYKEVRFTYNTLEERDKDLAFIRKTLAQSPFALFVNDIQEDEELDITVNKKKKKSTKTDDEEDLDLNDLED